MFNTFTSYKVSSGITSTSVVQYHTPSFDTAIRTLRPTVIKWEADSESFLVWEDSEENSPPTFEEIFVELERQLEIYNNYWYVRQRISSYPSIEVQLDMLYHDIKNDNLTNGKWIQAIDNVKELYPEGTMPNQEMLEE